MLLAQSTLDCSPLIWEHHELKVCLVHELALPIYIQYKILIKCTTKDKHNDIKNKKNYEMEFST